VSNNLPIGVFDSGVGGLTVASALKAALPREEIFYFGDTARCPYGDKTPAEVLEYSIEVCDFLTGKGVKLLVVACNTATAAALPTLQKRYAVPVVGVVDPGARAAVKATRRQRIGVIGTSVTIHSGVYETAIKRLAADAVVFSLACPEFVPLVERGETSGERVRRVVADRLEPLCKSDIDTLILGCTHYPHLQAVIQDVVGSEVRLISSAYETAQEVRRILAQRGLERDASTPPTDRFYTTGDSARMIQALREWMGLCEDHVEVVKVQLDMPTLRV
jgi:glutamate racemase